MDVFICKCMYGWEKNSLIYFKKIQIYYLDYYKVTFVNILHVEGFQQKIKYIFWNSFAHQNCHKITFIHKHSRHIQYIHYICIHVT
jgi:hypothetical protein